MRSDKQLYDLLISADCYNETVDKFDKSKVSRRRQGARTTQPGSNIGKVAWELGYRAWLQEQAPVDPPPPPPPPPPPVDKHFGIAPRTYNWAPSNNSDPRFCKQSPGVQVNSDGSFSDIYSRYDEKGQDIDGNRTRLTQVQGLRQADNSDGMGECQLYDGLTAWPEGSYDR
jgi:hypothetical protein